MGKRHLPHRPCPPLLTALRPCPPLQISATGFSQKLPGLLSRLLASLLEWDAAALGVVFEAERERIVRLLRSHVKSRADELAAYFLGLMLHPKRPPVPTRLAAAEAVSLDELRVCHAEAAARCSLRLFTAGNIAKHTARDLAAATEAQLAAAGAAPLPHAEWITAPVTRLPPGTRRLRVKPLSPEENNSGVYVYVQVGRLGEAGFTEADRARLSMYLRLLRQPLFAELRTVRWRSPSGLGPAGLGRRARRRVPAA